MMEQRLQHLHLNLNLLKNGLREYAIVLLSDSTEYTAWISRLGEPDVTSAANEAGQVFVSVQPVLGSLFKSQNASSWDASQYEDLKFELYETTLLKLDLFNSSINSSNKRIVKT